MTQVNVDSEVMGHIGKVTEDNVAAVVRGSLTAIDHSIKEATEKENWGGQSAENFIGNYEAIRNRLEQHVAELESLPGVLTKVGQDFRAQEEENTQNMRTNDVRSDL